ncbi:hypothetical protein GGS21DRAFT_509978 [Xylaria nigripes]|nr:hypothetical protein GGS21DRAFT_509978 [Xylaria nigripes]
MPPRPALFEFGTRNFICYSCLSGLRRQSAVTPWPIRHFSQGSATRKKRRSPEQEAERKKTMETLGLLKENANKIAVNYYEQGESGMLLPLQDENEFNKALVDPGGELDARLKEFEDQLQNVTSMAQIIEKMGGKEEVYNLRKRVSQDSDDDDVDDSSEETNLPLLSALAFSLKGFQGHDQDRIHRLNRCIGRYVKLKDTQSEFQPRFIANFWNRYLAARPLMRKRWHTVQGPAWDVLWKVFSIDHEFEASGNRFPRIYYLTKDMQSGGISLRPEQQLLAIEAMFVEGWVKEAQENHRRRALTLGESSTTSVRYWQLGLQMYCNVGDVERAERTAQIISESPYEVDPRYVLPLIKLYVDTSGSVESGFKLYRDLRAKLGDSIVIEDYDTIISYFLAAGHTEFALFIFVDMMKSGSIDLSLCKEYPPCVANPFFFGKWLKRLIGTGDLEGALSVLRLMRSRNIKPRAIQVNGLIGAWLRSGTADNVKKAEDIAWAMINTRLQFVELRRRESNFVGLNLEQSGDGWPRATLETFSLLAESYRERGLMAKMGSLWRSFQGAEVAPDSFLMNQILWSILQEGKDEMVLDIYNKMLKQFKTKPDPHTFMVLFQSLPANRSVKLQPKDIDVETSRTRSLYAHLIKHASIFKTNDGMVMDLFLARTILHSFRKTQDHCGLLLALRGLRRIFNYNPTDMVIFELMLNTKDLDRLPRRREGHKLIKAKTMFDDYLQYRYMELVKAGEISEDAMMPPEIRVEEAGNFLEFHLETALSDMEENEARDLAMETAIEMGLQTREAQEAARKAQEAAQAMGLESQETHEVARDDAPSSA